eukprot:1184224-Prorocentrum_minimum.AAC.2
MSQTRGFHSPRYGYMTHKVYVHLACAVKRTREHYRNGSPNAGGPRLLFVYVSKVGKVTFGGLLPAWTRESLRKSFRKILKCVSRCLHNSRVPCPPPVFRLPPAGPLRCHCATGPLRRHCATGLHRSLNRRAADTSGARGLAYNNNNKK